MGLRALLTCTTFNIPEHRLELTYYRRIQVNSMTVGLSALLTCAFNIPEYRLVLTYHRPINVNSKVIICKLKSTKRLNFESTPLKSNVPMSLSGFGDPEGGGGLKVGTLSPVKHKGLHRDRKQISVYLLIIHFTV